MDNPADNQALASELKLSLFKINKKDETKKVVSLVIRHRKKKEGNEFFPLSQNLTKCLG